MAQANSTAPPDQMMSGNSGDKVVATTSPQTHGVAFSLWTNGAPSEVLMEPGKSVDISKDLTAHTNVIVVKWNRREPKGVGMLTVRTYKRVLFTTDVTAKSPTRGSKSYQFKLSPAPVR